MSLRGLSVRAGDRVLLEGASADFPAGEVTLVIGASGAGKTVLMKILAGLIRPGDRDFEVRGSIRIEGVEVLDRAAGAPRGHAGVGIVFQNAALFDELSAAENIAFALDHRPRTRRGAGRDRPGAVPASPAEAGSGSGDTGAPAGAASPGGSPPPEAPSREPTPVALLSEFNIPLRVPVSALSGGQKQRLALARTLAYDPPVIIYDEPTAGLDAANALRVAARIREAGQAHGKTSIVVTHDYEHLAGIARTIYLLDPERRSLVPLDPGNLESLSRNLPGATTFQEGAPPPPVPVAARAWRGLLDALEGIGSGIEKGILSAASLVPAWRSVRWGLRYLVHYLGLVASPSSWLYFGAAGLIAGFVSTHFVYKFLPHKNYTEPLISDEILNGLGFALYRILVPVLLTILIAARCGAAVASDVGNRVYHHQVDAMRSMGASPSRYLLTGILWAFLVGTPLLVGIGFLAARTTSLAVFVHGFPEKGPNFWDRNFHMDLRIPEEPFYRGTHWLLAKLLVCGLGIGVIAYHVGISEKTSGVQVSRGITKTIIGATIFVLVVHFIFAFLEF